VVRLDQILGQPRALGQLRRMLESGKLPHALLFVGPPGVGKRTTAIALAATLNCERPDARPGAGCGTCGPCHKIEAGVHPDVWTLAPGGVGNVLAIEAIRELGQRLPYPPHEGRARVVVIEEADRMTPQAANAFLKTLEEPPARTHFALLTTAPDRLLVTVQSRCQRMRFDPLPGAAIVDILRAAEVPPERAQAVARLAGGSATRATELAEGDTLERRAGRARGLLRAVQAPGFRALTEAAAELAQAKEDIGPALEILALWYRAAMVGDGGIPGSPPSLPSDDEPPKDEDEDQALAAEARLPAAVLARRAACVLEAQTALLGYANAQLALENMLLQIREARP
jgi:DNA polymerase III subunit delta'